jgi:hypothetical protein
MNVSGTIPVKTTVEISRQAVLDMITSAFEGGSSWIGKRKINYAEGKSREDYEYPLYEVPFDGGSVEIRDCHGDFDTKTLDFDSIVKALDIIEDKLPDRHMRNIVEDTCDAETGDVLLQCALFGELVYG